MNNALPTQLKDFVDVDDYQQMVVDTLKVAKKLGATHAEIGASISIGLSVNVRQDLLETLEFNRDKAVGITVFIGHRKGSASTTDIQPKGLRATVEAAINLARLTEEDPYAGLAPKDEMAKDLYSLDLYHPWCLTIENAVELARMCEQSALSFDSKVTHSEGAHLHTTQGYRVYGNTHGFLGSYPSSRHSLSCVVIAQDEKQMERDYEYTLAREGQLLTSPKIVGEMAAKRALSRLSARKLITQKTPVLYHSHIAAGLINHFIAAISGNRLFRKSTFLRDSLGKKIFPDFIHIYERPHLLKGLGSALFDGDGVATRAKDIVKAGIIESYLLNTYSAKKLGLPNTGNAGGIHNLFVAPGEEDFAAMVKKMHRGLVATELMGQGVNLLTGDYSRGAVGFWVENGQIQYPVHEITIASNLRNMFEKLVAVGKDVDQRSNIQTGSLLIEEMMVAGL